MTQISGTILCQVSSNIFIELLLDCRDSCFEFTRTCSVKENSNEAQCVWTGSETLYMFFTLHKECRFIVFQRSHVKLC